MRKSQKSKGVSNTPRPYLSHSSYKLFKSNREEWKRQYIMGIRRQYASTAFGSRFAEAREANVDCDDEDINFARMFLPVYPKREHEMKVWNGTCWVLGIFDGYDPRKPLIADDKTTKRMSESGRPQPWTQNRVDKLMQLTWYAYIYWKKFHRIPQLELNWFDFDTKAIKTFRTTRTIGDMLQIHHEINKTWKEIELFCEEAYKII